MRIGADREYVLGTTDAELKRLGFQHQLWSEQAHQVWERARIGQGQTVLDIGCGPGFAAMDLAQIVGPTGRVIGVDASPGFVEYFNDQARGRGLGQARAFAGDASALTDACGIEPGTVDVAYARWLFCFVPDPEAVLDRALRALKPGGRLVVQDYFNYRLMTTAPRSEVVSRVVGATYEAWVRRGGDPDVMGRLPRLASERGLTIEYVGVHQRLARPGSTMWQWPETFWTNFLPVLTEQGLLTEADARAFHAELNRLAGTEYAFIQLPAVFDLIAVAPG